MTDKQFTLIMKAIKVALMGIGYILIALPGESSGICYKEYKKQVDKIND